MYLPLIIHEKYPFMIADVDRLVTGEDAGLECKTANAYNADKWKDGKVPLQYVVQCYHYMAVTGKKAWYIATKRSHQCINGNLYCTVEVYSRETGEIYDACRKICFFECIHEYFQYSREISREFLDAAVLDDSILEGLWAVYQKYEYLGIDTWEQVEEILEKYADIQAGKGNRTESRRL